MKINHTDAIKLERIVRRVFSCDRGEMGGYIDADHFESEPFDAALIALAPLWKKANAHELEDFLCKWDNQLRSESNEAVDIDMYTDELDSMISALMN